MSTDHETTSIEAAAQFEAARTPYYDERWDEYEPDMPGRTVTEHDPALVGLLGRCAREADQLLRESQPIREHASQADAALRGLSSWRRP